LQAYRITVDQELSPSGGFDKNLMVPAAVRAILPLDGATRKESERAFARSL